MEHFLHPTLFLSQTPQKGRGMFCHEAIPENTLLETSPVVPISKEERAMAWQTILKDYFFGWENEGCCMALGYIAMYNHSYQPNCRYEKDYTGQTISILSIRPIEAGEELTINYNGAPEHQGPLWFEVY